MREKCVLPLDRLSASANHYRAKKDQKEKIGEQNRLAVEVEQRRKEMKESIAK